MERMLLKMAQQLNAYDEASLTSLWEKYATIVERFEPTKRWEEAAVVFSLIQAVRLKNQLFNQHLAASLELAKDRTLPGLNEAMTWMEHQRKTSQQTVDSGKGASSDAAVSTSEGKAQKRSKVLSFSRRKGDKPVE